MSKVAILDVVDEAEGRKHCVLVIDGGEAFDFIANATDRFGLGPVVNLMLEQGYVEYDLKTKRGRKK